MSHWLVNPDALLCITPMILDLESQAGRCRAPHCPNSHKSPSELATHGVITPSFNKCPHYEALLHEGHPTGPCPFTPQALNATLVERRNAGCQVSLKWQLWPIHVWELEADETDEHSALSTEPLSSATYIEAISWTKVLIWGSLIKSQDVQLSSEVNLKLKWINLGGRYVCANFCWPAFECWSCLVSAGLMLFSSEMYQLVKLFECWIDFLKLYQFNIIRSSSKYICTVQKFRFIRSLLNELLKVL